MSPRDKAKDLVQKFEGLVATPFDGKGNIRMNDSVRQRALICCDEVIASHEEAKDVGNLKWKWAIIYWQSVKKELSKL